MSAKKKTRSVGRPRLPKGHAKRKIVPMRLSDEDFKLFSKAARASDQTLSDWMRSTVRGAMIDRKTDFILGCCQEYFERLGRIETARGRTADEIMSVSMLPNFVTEDEKVKGFQKLVKAGILDQETYDDGATVYARGKNWDDRHVLAVKLGLRTY